MKIMEVRNLTDSELVSKKKDARLEYFNLRLQQTTGALEKPSRLNELRKDYEDEDGTDEHFQALHHAFLFVSYNMDAFKRYVAEAAEREKRQKEKE